MSTKRISDRQVVACTLLLLPLVYFFPAITGQVALMIGDGATYSLFMHILVADLLSHGVLPLWNPFTFGGVPLLAAIQPAVLYPPNWLFVLLPANVAMNASVLSTYYLALIGAYLYARAIKAGRLAAFVTGAIFTFGGFLISHLDETNYTAAAAWMPWILLATEKLYQHASAVTEPEPRMKSWRALWRWVAIGAACVALQLFAGLPQATWHIVMVGAAYFLFSLWWRGGNENGWRFRRRFAIASASMAACGVLLSLIQLLPAVELQRQGDRAAISYETFSEMSMPVRSLVTLVFPFFFGGGKLALYHVNQWDDWWLHKWVNGYVGILGLLLVLLGLFTSRALGGEKRLVYFWTGVAVIALVLTLGDHLPFGFNHLLHRIPIYNLFRGSYRHMHEFTFATAVLAGFGVSALTSVEWERVRRALVCSSCTLGMLVLGVAIMYRFFASQLGAVGSPPARGTSLANPEAFVPLLLFGLSPFVLWFYGRRRTAIAGALLASVLLLDLASFGWFTGWRETPFDISAYLADSPAVHAIKERETDLRSFRVISYPIWPHGAIFGAINYGNLTISRGLQSAAGYDPMRLSRPAALAGNLGIAGDIRDESVFGPAHRGFDLLNVKYLLRERSGPIDASSGRVMTIDGLRFDTLSPARTLGVGARLELDVGATPATELAVVSTLTNSGGIPNGASVVSIKLHTSDGRVIERTLQAGRDTAEWAYDRADVRASIKHARAPVAESWDADGFEGHRYLARLTFDREEIDYIEFDNLRAEAEVVIARVTLSDARTGAAIPLHNQRLSPERWRLLSRFDTVQLYESLTVRPRAWFVNRVVMVPRSDLLKTIQSGKLRDGSLFDPAEVALLETEDFDGDWSVPSIGDTTGAEVAVTRYEANGIELRARNPQPGFLALSETYYSGWDALVDGVKTPVYRVNYALRGIALPSGEHRVEFVFRSPSFRMGAVGSAIGILLLVLGAVIGRHEANRDLRPEERDQESGKIPSEAII